MRSIWPLTASLAASRNENSVFAGLDLSLYRAEDSAGDCRLAVHHSPVPNWPMKVCPSGAIENTKSPEPLGSRQVPLSLDPSTRPSMTPSRTGYVPSTRSPDCSSISCTPPPRQRLSHEPDQSSNPSDAAAATAGSSASHTTPANIASSRSSAYLGRRGIIASGYRHFPRESSLKTPPRSARLPLSTTRISSRGNKMRLPPVAVSDRHLYDMDHAVRLSQSLRGSLT